MFDWPVAAVLLGVIGTIVVTVIKLMPQRMVVENSKGERCASKEEVREVLQAVHDHQKYVEMRNHDIINLVNSKSAESLEKMGPIRDAVLLLLERTPRRRRANDDETN